MAAKTVNRYDSITPSRWMTAPFTRTTEGFLTGRAIVTSIGVFTYRNADGSATRELRLPEEVFAIDSLETMKLKPVTNDHPKETVTPENVTDLEVGTLGSNPTTTVQERTWDGYTDYNKLTDGIHVAIDMSIKNKDAIEDVLNGKRALSMGYSCEMEKADEGAVWCGMAYDAIQRNIRYNHCAIVDAARAGDAAAIRLDSADAVLDTSTTLKEGSMKKIKLDGVDCDVDDYVATKVTELLSRHDAAEKAAEQAKADHQKALSTLEAERDTAKDRADKAEKDLKEAKEKADKALDPKRLDELVAAKVAILDAADKAGVEVKNDMDDAAIKKAVITAVFPTAKLDGKDAAYIEARYDSAVETLEGRDDGVSRAVASDNPNGSTREDAAAARQRMIEYNARRSRGEKTED